jgi:hypothetical protein
VARSRVCVMPEGQPYKSSEHYHSRAEECRTIADLFHNETTRAKMLIVADDYDKMARSAETIETSRRAAAPAR